MKKDSLNKDYETFEKEALKYIPYLYSVAHKLTNGNLEEAEDLVQETYEKALSAFDSFKKDTNLKAWLSTIEKNTFINKYRKDKKISFVKGKDDTDEDYGWQVESALLKNDSSAIESDFSNETSNELVNQALNSLDKDKRMLLYYIDVEGLSYKEVSEILSIPMGTVMSRIHRVRNELRKKLISLYKQQIDSSKENITADDIHQMR